MRTRVLRRPIVFLRVRCSILILLIEIVLSSIPHYIYIGPRRRWEDNMKMDLREVGGGGDWMELAQDRDRWRALVNTVMNVRVP